VVACTPKTNDNDDAWSGSGGWWAQTSDKELSCAAGKRASVKARSRLNRAGRSLNSMKKVMVKAYAKYKRACSLVKAALRHLAKVKAGKGGSTSSTKKPTTNGGRKCKAKANVLSHRICAYYARRFRCGRTIRFRTRQGIKVANKHTCATTCLCPWKKQTFKWAPSSDRKNNPHPNSKCTKRKSLPRCARCLTGSQC